MPLNTKQYRNNSARSPMRSLPKQQTWHSGARVLQEALMNNDTPSGMLARAISAVRNGGGGLLRMLNELPAAIYITDTQGVVTHFNQTCIAFAGRTPRVGQDSWCVTWKLYTEEGEYLPH